MNTPQTPQLKTPEECAWETAYMLSLGSLMAQLPADEQAKIMTHPGCREAAVLSMHAVEQADARIWLDYVMRRDEATQATVRKDP